MQTYLGDADEHTLDEALEGASEGRVSGAAEPLADADPLALLAVSLDLVDLDGGVAEVPGHGSAGSNDGDNTALDVDGLDWFR